MKQLTVKRLMATTLAALTIMVSVPMVVSAADESPEESTGTYYIIDVPEGAYTDLTEDIIASMTADGITTLTAGMYLVKNDTVIDAIAVSGDVSLIVADGVTLSIKKSEIDTSKGTIKYYAQSAGTNSGTFRFLIDSTNSEFEVDTGVGKLSAC